jgi:hypothetical protein
MRTLQDFAKPGGGQPRLPATTPTVNVATSEQIHTLLNVTGALAAYLMTGEEDVDKEARLAASATFLRATDRLDHILADDKRWQVGEYDEVIKNLNTMYKKQSAYMEAATKRDNAETKRSKEMIAPHNLRRVEVYALNNGEWMVSEGDISDKSTLKAIGTTPAEAAEAFDRIWNGEAPYQPFSVGTPKNADEATDEVGGGTVS